MPIYGNDDTEITEPNLRRSNSLEGKTPPRLLDDDDVQAFLDEFAHALTSGDGEGVAALWDVPALVVGDDMVRSITNAAELVAFFGGAKDQYAEHGVTGTRGEILSLDRPTPKIVQLTVRWPWLDDNGNEVGSESSSYVLRKDDAGNLKLRVAVMRGATHEG